VATPQQRRPGDLSRAGAFEDLRPQPRQNPSKAQRDLRAPFRHVCSVIGEARRAAPGRDQSFRAGQFLQHARPQTEACSTQVRSTQIGVAATEKRRRDQPALGWRRSAGRGRDCTAAGPRR
jgi:hypothetical protein